MSTLEDEALAHFADVILPLPLGNLYTYRIPLDMQAQVKVGQRVVVQFGKKKLYSAIVHTVHSRPPRGYEAKYILSVFEEDPIVSPELMQFWEWMARYYMCTLGEVMQAALPAPFKAESETSISLHPECDIASTEWSEKEYLVIEALSMHPSLTLEEVSEIVQLKNVFPLLRGLHRKEAIIFSEDLKETYKPRYVTCVKLNESFADEDAMRELFNVLEKKTKQLDLLMAFLHLRNQHKDIEKKLLLSVAGSSESTLATLVKKDVLALYRAEKERLEGGAEIHGMFELNGAQQTAFNELKAGLNDKGIALLHGITSSGKTHIYVKLMEEAVQAGKQVLFLLPEIALTSQIVARMKKYFGDAAVAFHSKFSQNERVELWNRIASGQASVVIGARSSVFLPFQSLGLVIVDEEHESSYKQADPAPRYHARDAATYLGQRWKCPVVLGSATPSFETYSNCLNDKYALVKLTQRFGEVEVPEMITANIAEETRVKTMKGHFTSRLADEINEAIAAKKQVILFQNRRGYAPVLECQDCHWVPKCKNCDISLTYHKYNDSLKCHYCGYSRNVPKTCEACSGVLLNLKGLGTEKIEDELNAYFPEARVMRLDLDAARTKHGHEQIIHAFENHEADILVGTQMISKGLDFANVSLVGIINADQLLYFPDFRAHERAYQLIQQVAGRAGRKDLRGKVIVQTSTPHHRVILDAIHHRYEDLFNFEQGERKQYNYPPYSRLIRLVIRHTDARVAQGAAFSLYDKLHKRLGDKLFGPESPYVSRVRNLFIKEILVKLERNDPYLQSTKTFILSAMKATQTEADFKRVSMYADVDPF